MSHMNLPPLEENISLAAPIAVPTGSVLTPAPISITGCGGAEVKPAIGWEHGGNQVYLIKVGLGETGLAGFSIFTHPKDFSQEELGTMLAATAQIVNETKVQTRRKALVKDRTPLEDPVKINEEFFRLDADFFETVLMDKYGFSLLRAHTGEINLEPTIKGVK